MKKITMKAARVNAGIRQAEMAEKVGMSVNTVCDWEKGRKYPTMEQLQKYCDACGCKVSDVDCKVIVLRST